MKINSGLVDVYGCHYKLYEFDSPPDPDLNPLVGTESFLALPVTQDVCVDAGIVYSFGVEIEQEFRGQGYGQKAHESRLNEYKVLYNYALCTVNRNNDIQLHILKKNGWVRLANTTSGQGNPIYLMGRNLK